MVLCFAADCNHQYSRDRCSYYRFPKDEKTFQLWTLLSRRADRRPRSYDRLCSCHFKDGKRVNGPSIFQRNTTTDSLNSPEKRILDFQKGTRTTCATVTYIKPCQKERASKKLRFEPALDNKSKCALEDDTPVLENNTPEINSEQPRMKFPFTISDAESQATYGVSKEDLWKFLNL